MSRERRPLPPPLTIDEPLPKACDAHLVARVFGISVNTVYDWHKVGKLRKFELRQPMGSKRWSGARLQEFLDANRPALALQKAG